MRPLACLLVLAAAPALADAPPAAPHPVRLELGSQLKDVPEIQPALMQPFAGPYQVEVGRPAERRILRNCAELGADFPAGLQTVDPVDQRPLRRPGLYLKGRDYEARMSIFARGDFNADGIEDILIRRDGFTTGGSYQEFGLFLLTRPAAGAPLKVLRSFSDGY